MSDQGDDIQGLVGPAVDDWVALNAAQRAMARHVRAAAEIPTAALFVDVNASVALAGVDELKHIGISATFTSIVVYVVAQALRRFNIIAAEFDFSENRYRIPAQIGIGVAVAAPRGLYVPVLHDALNLSLGEIATQLSELVRAARENQLRPGMQRGGHFTVTNIGGLGIHGGVPIINPPQNAILGVASARQVAIVRNGELGVGMETNLTLTIDHRAIDGITAARFLTAIVTGLETGPFPAG